MNIGTRVFDKSLQNCARVAAVIDGEVFVVTKALALAAKNCNAGRVKGLDPHSLGICAEQLAHTFAHLGGGLVGEGDGKNLARPRLFVGKQVGDSVG